jgi:hypothetical protein
MMTTWRIAPRPSGGVGRVAGMGVDAGAGGAGAAATGGLGAGRRRQAAPAADSSNTPISTAMRRPTMAKAIRRPCAFSNLP